MVESERKLYYAAEHTTRGHAYAHVREFCCQDPASHHYRQSGVYVCFPRGLEERCYAGSYNASILKASQITRFIPVLHALFSLTDEYLRSLGTS